MEFMVNYPELGRVDSLDIYADEYLDVYRCPTQLQHLNFVDCAPYPGLACNFECKAGYQPVANNTAVCDYTGKWSPPIDTLCIETTCPLNVENASLSSTCRGSVGEKCDVICNGATTCPLNVENATLSSTCRGSIGEKCGVICNGGTSVNTAHIVCLSSGVWDNDTSVICSPIQKPERYTPPEASKTDMTYVYVGISIGVVVVVAMVFIGVLFFKKRRNNPAQDRSLIQDTSSNEINRKSLTLSVLELVKSLESN
uniref:Uncharacterized protein n=1 Tax=Magallana gigas TaxID=29159 RepID=K1QAS8_MAGGI